jgi:hypothetical protein
MMKNWIRSTDSYDAVESKIANEWLRTIATLFGGGLTAIILIIFFHGLVVGVILLVITIVIFSQGVIWVIQSLRRARRRKKEGFHPWATSDIPLSSDVKWYATKLPAEPTMGESVSTEGTASFKIGENETASSLEGNENAIASSSSPVVKRRGIALRLIIGTLVVSAISIRVGVQWNAIAGLAVGLGLEGCIVLQALFYRRGDEIKVR